LGAPYQVNANGNVYEVVDDCTTVYRAVVIGGATDEIFGTLAAPGFAVELASTVPGTKARTDLGTKAFDNGLYALTGYPGRSFPHLDMMDYTVDYVLTAPGFSDLPLTANIPMNAIFPVPGPTAVMRRLPIRIQGRVVSGSTRLPIGGAVIASIDNPASPPTVHATVLGSPLYFAHTGGVSVRAATIVVTGSSTLNQAVTGGDRVVALSTRTGLAHGSVIRLTNGGGVAVEYAIVDDPGPGPASSPGEVSLGNALNYSFPSTGTAVDFVTVTPTGTLDQLSADADMGDGVLLATSLFTQTIVLESGTALEEVHDVGALSDLNGYYGFDGIGHVQELFLRASQGAATMTADWFVEYDQPLNLVDFRL
jgi:hypothetical protein